MYAVIVNAPGGITPVRDHNDLEPILGMESCYRMKQATEGDTAAKVWLKTYLANQGEEQRAWVYKQIGGRNDDEVVERMIREAEKTFFVLRSGQTFLTKKNEEVKAERKKALCEYQDALAKEGHHAEEDKKDGAESPTKRARNNEEDKVESDAEPPTKRARNDEPVVPEFKSVPTEPEANFDESSDDDESDATSSTEEAPY